MVQNKACLNKSEEGLEIPQVVQDKMARSVNSAGKIDEQAVNDLKFVNVTSREYRVIKRALDIILSAIGLVVIAVPMLIVFAIMYIDDPGQVLFSQYRVGLGGRRFKLYKLRTMRCDTPKYLSTSEVDDPNKYITRVGRVLRKWSIDELPQLINIVKGDMSIVGPRPLISDEYEIHELRFKCGVYKVRPGLTGLAQINGRDTVTPADKVRWDVKYLENFGFITDAKIVLATIPKLFGASGVVEGFKHTTENERK
ncbi:MAG: sugar transferase [Clostridia bacterium]|nr:sugar transferase [Clostridia bacterium]